MCVNFTCELRNLQSGGDCARQFFEELFMAILIMLRVFCQISAERKSLKKYFVLLELSGLEFEC